MLHLKRVCAILTQQPACRPVIQGVSTMFRRFSPFRAATVALTPGSFWTDPQGANHYGWPRDGDVIAVGAAKGPTGMAPAGSQ